MSIPKPKLKISSVNLNKGELYVGTRVEFKVTTKNYGDDASSRFKVLVYDAYNPNNLLAEDEESGLDPGIRTYSYLSFVFPTVSAGRQKLRFVIMQKSSSGKYDDKVYEVEKEYTLELRTEITIVTRPLYRSSLFKLQDQCEETVKRYQDASWTLVLYKMAGIFMSFCPSPASYLPTLQSTAPGVDPEKEALYTIMFYGNCIQEID